MSDPAAEWAISELRKLDVHEADRRLCAMHSDLWHRIARILGVTLPAMGGDPPVILGAALRRAKAA